MPTQTRQKSPPVPRFAFHGGKGKLAKKITSLLPPSGQRFVEPFAGRGNVYFHVAQRLDYKEFWLNDHYMFRFFVALMHSMEDGIEWTLPDDAEYRYDEEFYDFLRRRAKERIGKENRRPEWGTVVERRWRPVISADGKKGWVVEQYPPLFVIECFLSYSGGTFDSGMKGVSEKNVTREGFMRNVRLAHDIMQRTQPRLTNYDYKNVLVECGPDDMVYLDPPYWRRNVSGYPNNTLRHDELVEILLRARFKWVLSEYKAEIYNPLTEKFGAPLEVPVPKDMGFVRDGKRERAFEYLWKNF